MGSYGYELRLDNARTKKAVTAAARELWEWFRFEVKSLVNDPLGEVLLEFIDDHTPTVGGRYSNATWPSIKCEDSTLVINISDGGGYAYNMSLASVHMLTLLTEQQPEIVYTVLKRHQLARSKKQEIDKFIRAERFFAFRGSVATIAKVDGTTLVSCDAGPQMPEGGEFRLDELPLDEAKAVRGFIRRRACECPVCRSSVR